MRVVLRLLSLLVSKEIGEVDLKVISFGMSLACPAFQTQAL
jgi:hypothetical protein